MEGTDLATHAAAPERASAEQLAGQRAKALAHPVVRAMLPKMKGYIAVLNSHRQILVLNDAFVITMGFENSMAALGLRVGEAIGCVHSRLMPAGCGTSVHCAACGALVATIQALSDGVPERHRFRPTVRQGLLEPTLNFFARGTGYDLGDERVVLLALQQAA